MFRQFPDSRQTETRPRLSISELRLSIFESCAPPYSLTACSTGDLNGYTLGGRGCTSHTTGNKHLWMQLDCRCFCCCSLLSVDSSYPQQLLFRILFSTCCMPISNGLMRCRYDIRWVI